MHWYYSKNGTQLGPVAEEELRGKIASGEIAPTDLVWKEGMSDWLPAANVPGLAVAASHAGPPATTSPYAAPTTHTTVYHGEPIPKYLWQSIVVTVLCCLPFGIPAIVYAAKVDGLKQAGDINGARAASASAKTWCTVSFGLGLAVLVLYVIVMVAAGVSA